MMTRIILSLFVFAVATGASAAKIRLSSERVAIPAEQLSSQVWDACIDNEEFKGFEALPPKKDDRRAAEYLLKLMEQRRLKFNATSDTIIYIKVVSLNGMINVTEALFSGRDFILKENFIIGKTKSAILKNEKYNFREFSTPRNFAV